LSELDAKVLLEYAVEHPPFINKPHWLLSPFTIFLGSAITTYLATSLSVESFQDINMLSVTLFAAKWYGGAYLFDWLMDKYWVDIKSGIAKAVSPVTQRVEKAKGRLVERLKVRACGPHLSQ